MSTDVVCPGCGTCAQVPQTGGRERSSVLSWLVANKRWKPVDNTVVCPECGSKPV